SFLGAKPVRAQTPNQSAELDDHTYLVMADQIHSAAMIVYVEATSVPGLDDEAEEAIATCRHHHKEIVSAIGDLMGSEAAAATTVPDPTILAVRDELGGDQSSALRTLTRLEEQLAATHLQAIGVLTDDVSAQTAAGVLATSHQRST